MSDATVTYLVLGAAVAVISALVPALGAYRADAGELLNTR